MALLLTLGETSNAWALDDADKEAIRTLSNEAAAALEKGEHEVALDKFSRAYEIAKVPRLAVWVARANEKLGKLVKAYEYYRQAVRLRPNELWVGELQTQAQQEAETALKALTPRLAKITIKLEGAYSQDVAVTLDGAAIPPALLGVERFVDPGKREIVGTRDKDVAREVATLEEGGKRTVILKFIPRPRPKNAAPVTALNQPGQPPTAGAKLESASSSSQPTWGWVTLGVGAAGLIGGGVAAYVTKTKGDGLEELCQDRVCDRSHEHRVEVYRTWRLASTTSFIVGGVAAELGLVLLLTSPKSNSSERAATNLSLWATPEMAGLEGTF